MPEKQLSQIFESWQSIICKRSRLPTFFSKNSNTNMSTLNHIDIIRPISDRHCNQTWPNFTSKPFADKFNSFCFLCWRTPKDNHARALAENVLYFILMLRLAENYSQSLSWNLQVKRVNLRIVCSSLNFWFYSIKTQFYLIFVYFQKYVSVAVFVKSAFLSNLQRSFFFIACEHPNLNSSHLYLFNASLNIFL